MNAWLPAEPPFDSDSFSGVGRLFPLPEVVSFPSVVTPLHVFEERYRALTADALDSDGLITMAVLQPGWESDYDGRPPLCGVGCLTKIISHHQAEDGTYNLLLLGMRRVRLRDEIQPPQAFRRARLDLIEEQDPSNEPDGLRKRLIRVLSDRLKPGAAAQELEQALGEATRLGAVADLAAYSLPLATSVKLDLLAEPRSDARCHLILDAVDGLSDDEPIDFPPPFSSN